MAQILAGALTLGLLAAGWSAGFFWYLLIPGVGRGSSGGIDEALDVTTGC